VLDTCVFQIWMIATPNACFLHPFSFHKTALIHCDTTIGGLVHGWMDHCGDGLMVVQNLNA